MIAFAFHQPSSLKEAVSLLGSASQGRPLAGGMTLLPTMKQRLAAPEALIDLSSISGLRGCTNGEGSLTIGAMTRHVDVARSEVVVAQIPALATLAAGI